MTEGYEEIATSGKALLAMKEYGITLAMTMTGEDCHGLFKPRNDGVWHQPRNDVTCSHDTKGAG